MTFLQKINLIKRLDQLIKLKATGTADELSIRLGVSRRCVFDIINLMKAMEAPIRYSSQKKTFYYEYECELSIGFIDSNKVIKKIK